TLTSQNTPESTKTSHLKFLALSKNPAQAGAAVAEAHPAPRASLSGASTLSHTELEHGIHRNAPLLAVPECPKCLLRLGPGSPSYRTGGLCHSAADGTRERR